MASPSIPEQPVRKTRSLADMQADNTRLQAEFKQANARVAGLQQGINTLQGGPSKSYSGALGVGLSGAGNNPPRTYSPGTPQRMAVDQINKQIAEATAYRDAFTPQFRDLTKEFNEYRAGQLVAKAAGGFAAPSPTSPKADFSGVTARVSSTEKIVNPAATDAAPTPTAQSPADGIYRGKSANGVRVYSDSTAGLEEGITKTNAGFGRGTPEAQRWLSSVQPLAGSQDAAPQPSASPAGGPPQAWSASHGVHAPGSYGPATQAPLRTATLAASPAAMAPMSQGAAPSAGMPAITAGSLAPASVQAASTATPAAAVGGAQRLLGGNPMPAPVAAAAPQFERVLPASVPMTQTSTGRGGVIENPGDSTANKLQRALTSYSVKGSPSTRAAIAQAILGEAGARQNERMQTLKTQDQAALDAMKLNADAAKGNADRRLSADKFNAESQDTREHRRQLVELERSKPFQYEQGEDGTRTIVRNDGSLTPITDANGAPAKFVAPQRGLSHDVAFKAFNDRAQAIESGMGTAEEKAAALEALRQEPMFAQFVGAGQQAAAVPEVSARKAGEVYDTPKGKMKWTGTGWVSAQ